MIIFIYEFMKMPKNLVIVESPGKIKKIQSFLGDDYLVVASYGHIRDLDSKGISIDLDGFKPNYTIMKDKHDVVRKLKNYTKECCVVILAADEDREGEAIAWHCKELLSSVDPRVRFERIVFNSITKKAIIDAVNNPKDIDMSMVMAQQTRRLIDRIVGYQTTPTLWKNFIGESVSAGRVQSIVLKVIVSREDEIMNSNRTPLFVFNGTFTCSKVESMSASMSASMYKNSDPSKIFKTADQSLVESLLEQMIKTKHKVGNIENIDTQKKPPLPYITSSLQMDVGKSLGYTVKKTMEIAQKLYEEGHITYMRTDSTNIASEAIKTIKSIITEKYGEEFIGNFQSKNKKGAQEAHEAIRPTKLMVESAGSTPEQKKMYQMIWKRTIMAIMAPAIIQVMKIRIDCDSEFDSQDSHGISEYHFITKHEITKSLGWMILLSSVNQVKDSKKDIIDIKVNDELQRKKVTAVQEYNRVPSRYNEPGLIKKLEQLNIGRPSTYVSMVMKVMDRKYVDIKDIVGEEYDSITYTLVKKIVKKNKKVTLGAEKKRMTPTDLGNKVCRYLEENVNCIMDYEFTSRLEKNLDKIAKSKCDWMECMNEFYQEFHPFIDKILGQKTIKSSMNVIKSLVHPENNQIIELVDTKYGKAFRMMVDDKYRYINVKNLSFDFNDLQEKDSIDDGAIQELVEMFSYPLVLGRHKNNIIELRKGPYGLYLRWKNKNYSVNKKIELEEAIKIVDSK